MDRREFLIHSAGAAGAAAIAALPEKKELVPSMACGPTVQSGDIHVGILAEPLRCGSKARVYTTCPQNSGWRTWYEVYGSDLMPPCGYPAGHPVAFASINNRMETVGW